VEHQIDGKIFPSLTNIAIVEYELFAFKLQTTIKWMDKNIKDLWSMITWNSSF
jgi:hypothetical protein